MDLSGVSRAALLEIIGGVARGATRVKTILQMSLSGVRLMTYSRSGTTDLMSKSSELIIALNLERSPKRVPRLLGERSRHAVGRVCKANIRSSTWFLRPIYVRKRATAIKYLSFVAKSCTTFNESWKLKLVQFELTNRERSLQSSISEDANSWISKLTGY